MEAGMTNFELGSDVSYVATVVEHARNRRRFNVERKHAMATPVWLARSSFFDDGAADQRFIVVGIDDRHEIGRGTEARVADRGAVGAIQKQLGDCIG
jgi:hypothetical protein